MGDIPASYVSLPEGTSPNKKYPGWLTFMEKDL